MTLPTPRVVSFPSMDCLVQASSSSLTYLLTYAYRRSHCHMYKAQLQQFAQIVAFSLVVENEYNDDYGLNAELRQKDN
jgi:hypothetical protein